MNIDYIKRSNMDIKKNMFECRKYGSDNLSIWSGYISEIKCNSCGNTYESN